MNRFWPYTIAIAVVMCLACGFVRAQGPDYPSGPQGYVSDYATVVRPQDKDVITRLAQELEERTTDQIAVVTVNTTQPETIEGYAVELFKRWGIGHKGKDNGALLLVAVNDRKMRIETGYGLEGVLPDVICNKIIRDIMVPSFRSGDYSTGIKDGAVAIISVIAKEKGLNITGQEGRIDQQFSEQDGSANLVWFFILIVIISILSRMPGGMLFMIGGMYGGGFSGGRGGFSGGGGGFSGFGGGMSGGGGASGGW